MRDETFTPRGSWQGGGGRPQMASRPHSNLEPRLDTGIEEASTISVDAAAAADAGEAERRQAIEDIVDADVEIEASAGIDADSDIVEEDRRIILDVVHVGVLRRLPILAEVILISGGQHPADVAHLVVELDWTCQQIYIPFELILRVGKLEQQLIRAGGVGRIQELVVLEI